MNPAGFLKLLIPDPIWKWDHFTNKYDNYPLGDGQWHMIMEKLILTAQEFVKQVFSYKKIIISPPTKRKLKKNEKTERTGQLNKDGIYCTYTFNVGFGNFVYTFVVKNIPVSSDAQIIEIFFNAVLNYLSSAYISLESNLSKHQSGHLLASHDLMRIADSFIMSFSKTVMLEYLYYILNFEKVQISERVHTYQNHNRYNLQLLEMAYEFAVELSSRKIENKEIYTGFIFHNSEEELHFNSVERIKLIEPIKFGSFSQLKSIIPSTNGKNIFFNVINNIITHIFITRENVPEIAMEPFEGGKTFAGKPLILSIQGHSKVIFLQGDIDRNRTFFQIINSKPIIKDYSFIENYLDNLLDKELTSNKSPRQFIKWLLKVPVEKKGTTVIIGNFKKNDIKRELVSYANVSINSSMLFQNEKHLRELLDYITKPDGALIFNTKGKLLFMSSILPFAQGKKVVGGGARHQSTINFTKMFKCIGITISEDGSISVFKKGKLEIKF